MVLTLCLALVPSIVPLVIFFKKLFTVTHVKIHACLGKIFAIIKMKRVLRIDNRRGRPFRQGRAKMCSVIFLLQYMNTIYD